MRAHRAAAAVMFIGLVGGPAFAQAPPAKDKDPTAKPAEGSDPKKMEEPRLRYQRGIQLFNEGNFEAARVEFERAYALAPSYKILYNIGLSYEQLGDYVQAQTTLQRYLDLGGTEIQDARRSEVAKELAQIRPRIARVTVKTNVPGTELFVDDVCGTDSNSGNINCGSLDGTSREVLMNPGRRRVTLRHTGYLPNTVSVTVAGSDRTEVSIELSALPKYEERNPYLLPMWIGWGVTFGGVVTTAVAGGLALKASSDLQKATDAFGATRQDLDDKRSKQNTLRTVADVALAGTIVAAGVSTYFTIRALNWKTAEGNKESGNVQVGLGSVAFSGRF
jgi:tetratricopeptide (TPR) repeat protein